MAIKHLSDIDLNKNQLKYASIPHLEQPKIMVKSKNPKKKYT